MEKLLRRSRSTIYDINTQIEKPQLIGRSGLIETFNSIRNRRKSRVDLSTAVESESSVGARWQQEAELNQKRSISHLKRRLVRKASTLNLNSKHHTSTSRYHQERERSEYLFPDPTEDEASPAPNTSNAAEVPRPSRRASTVYSEAAETVVHRSPSSTDQAVYSRVTAIPAEPSESSHRSSDELISVSAPELVDRLIAKAQREILEAQNELVSRYPNYREKHTTVSGVWGKMAALAAEPPLPYEKLKQITVEACDTALSSTKSYDHSKTELWNTTIINTILSQLVGETTASSATTNGASVPPSQSKWKFVVNSTIIQHRNNSADDASSKTTGGRRGMHSAAGAYWSNDKDGMWSFKYEAADKMGLDVIVGIVWVWVG